MMQQVGANLSGCMLHQGCHWYNCLALFCKSAITASTGSPLSGSCAAQKKPKRSRPALAAAWRTILCKRGCLEIYGKTFLAMPPTTRVGTNMIHSFVLMEG